MNQQNANPLTEVSVSKRLFRRWATRLTERERSDCTKESGAGDLITSLTFTLLRAVASLPFCNPLSILFSETLAVMRKKEILIISYRRRVVVENVRQVHLDHPQNVTDISKASNDSNETQTQIVAPRKERATWRSLIARLLRG